MKRATLRGVSAALLWSSTGAAWAASAPPSLKMMAPPTPAGLAEFVRDEAAAIALGKAFFWDMQAGSDGVQACGTCHFHAGADSRTKNQLNPGTLHGAVSFEVGGPNATVAPGDFPFHALANPDVRTSTVLRDSDDVMSSQGVFRSTFQDIVPGQAEESCAPEADPIWNVGGTNVRQVEPRHTPTTINAVFAFRSFWNGRANHVFNGVNPFGVRDPGARVLRVQSGGVVAPVQVAIAPGALASQAVGPPLSPVEMSCGGRSFPKLGKKLLALLPLAKQVVDPSDGVLGIFASSVVTPGIPGLQLSYADLIQAAFQPQWWDSAQTVTFSGGQPTVSPPSGSPLTTDQFTLMEANFSLFWGLAIQLYETTLVSDDAPYDRFKEGDATAFNAAAQEGLRIFLNEGLCISHHLTPLFSGATTPTLGGEENIQEMDMASGRAFYDGGFYNIGVRPTAEDVGVGGEAPVGEPLGFARRVQLGLDVSDLAGIFTPPPIGPTSRTANSGAFKTPTLRNVELTAPYMHNGGMLTLEQVVDFYARGGDFHEANIGDLDPNIVVIAGTNGNAQEKAALVAFLKSLTDERVRFEMAPFDHPQLFVPDGHLGDATGVIDDGTGKAADDLREVAAVGALGRCTGIDGTARLCPGGDPPPAPVDLSPIADTYIEAGTEAAWDHGLAGHMDVDMKPVGIAYLEFDVSGVTAPIQRATLSLSCTNSSPDGGTVYLVRDAGWPEGDRNGLDASSAGGPGLKFTDVDTNHDGQVTAADSSSDVPDFAHPIVALGAVAAGQRLTLDVTSAFTGPGVYTLAIKNGNTDGATYTTRHAANAGTRPRLRLELAAQATCVTDTDCDDGDACTRDSCSPSAKCSHASVPCATITPVATPTASPTRTASATLTTSPTPTVSVSPTATPSVVPTVVPTTIELTPIADTYIEAGTEASWDHGVSDHLDVDLQPFGIGYLKVVLPTSATVRQATLTLFCSNASVDGGTVYPVTDSTWIEGTRNGLTSASVGGPGLTWTDVDTNRDGKVTATDGSPFVPLFTRPVATLGAVAKGRSYDLDVTSAFQSGAGTYTLAIKNGSSDGATYWSREYPTVARRPRLRLVLAGTP